MSRAVAALGDSALLLPASFLLGLYLLALGRTRLAFCFWLALAAAGGVTVALKIGFHACGHAVSELDVMSPSGHVSFAFAFYGSLAALLAAGRPRAVRLGAAAAASLIVLAVGASRIRTRAHTVEEVVIGLAVGAAAVALFLILRTRLAGAGMAARPIPAWPVAAGFAGALLLLGGSHFSLEGVIGRTARNLSAALDVCGEPDPDFWRRLRGWPERG